jgi:hypothetical protein
MGDPAMSNFPDKINDEINPRALAHLIHTLDLLEKIGAAATFTENEEMTSLRLRLQTILALADLAKHYVSTTLSHPKANP